MTGLIVVVAVLGVATACGLLLRRRNGRLRVVHASSADMLGPVGILDRLDAAALGAPLGERATLLQFSTAFCAPCRATRRILADVALVVPGVSHVEIDAESHLDLVRRLGVLRTPTVLILDQEGGVTRRASGAPRKAEVLAALADVVPAVADIPAGG